MIDSALTPNRRLLKRLLTPFFGERIDYGSITLSRLPLALLGLVPAPDEPAAPWPGGGRAREETEAIFWLGRDLALWRILADRIGAEILYVLQPLGGWVRKRPTAEESELFGEVARSRRRFNQVLAHELDGPAHARFAEAVTRECRAAGLSFLDMNAALSAAGLDDQWIFNDYIHLTDAGYDKAGALIAERLAQVAGPAHRARA